MDNNKIFHLGLCMAGSVSAGAYTAGVIDFLQEALENWEEERKNGVNTIPDHQVVIDLLGGASGGGITSALTFFGLRNNMPHSTLDADGRTFTIDKDKNIYWKVWVELTKSDILKELLMDDDIKEGYIPSLLNANFVDEVATIFEEYIQNGEEKPELPAYLNERAELFLTLFNVTGIKYKLKSKSPAATEQFISEHRDLSHFRWSDLYEDDGRMEISFGTAKNLKPLLQSAKATGAFPVGLKGRIVEREAKYIWDNPYFQKNGKFDRTSIKLGDQITQDSDIYKTINGDGGTANNEPVEFCRDLLLNIRVKQYEDIHAEINIDTANPTEKSIQKKKLTNSSVLLIDPFPSYDFELKTPDDEAAHLLKYLPKFIFALNSQLIFDAKDAFEAYDIKNYGLHVIAPSREGVAKPEYAIACGSLSGFGGFFNKDFRIHDYFLGRHNCQSFLRKYFVVDLNESDPQNVQCVQSIIDAYKSNPAAVERFSYTDETGKQLVPIIPDVKLASPVVVMETNNADGSKTIRYVDPDPLPLYKLEKLSANYFDEYREEIKKRIRKIINSLFDAGGFADLAINIAANAFDDKIADKILDFVIKDLKERDLLK
ncbi:MAG: hypothetical protein JWN56_1221 [Sphingobacteriales bacterium]|nr:hypothetical protein [Sphingobacteriales bacterium]